MIADLSLNSVEVYFECGLSWGLGRSLCPVVRSDDRRQFLPKWLLDLQVVNYGSDSGMQELLQRIRKVGTEKNSKSRNRCESAVPGKIAIVSSATDQITHQNAIIKAACGIYGMSYTQSEAFSDRELAVELPRSIADASLLIINIQGDFSEADLFGIFCTGAILSHPSSGIDTKKLLKQVLIVTHGASPESIKIFPDSAKRIRNVKIISPNALTKEVHSFGVNYRKWVLLQATATKGSQDAKKPIGR